MFLHSYLLIVMGIAPSTQRITFIYLISPVRMYRSVMNTLVPQIRMAVNIQFIIFFIIAIVLSIFVIFYFDTRYKDTFFA